MPVHPTQLYEAGGAFLVAALLGTLQRRVDAITVFGTYLALSGATRLVVEFIRVGDPALFGLTEVQLFSIASMLVGSGLILLARRRARRTEAAIRATIALSFGAPKHLQP